jgi:hypothetical protein
VVPFWNENAIRDGTNINPNKMPSACVKLLTVSASKYDKTLLIAPSHNCKLITC